MALMNIEGEQCEVARFSVFPRGSDGKCAFCKGDATALRSDKDNTPIGRFYRDNPKAESCPCCDGRPS
jgi:hypothetical protein